MSMRPGSEPGARRTVDPERPATCSAIADQGTCPEARQAAAADPLRGPATCMDQGRRSDPLLLPQGSEAARTDSSRARTGSHCRILLRV